MIFFQKIQNFVSKYKQEVVAIFLAIIVIVLLFLVYDLLQEYLKLTYQRGELDQVLDVLKQRLTSLRDGAEKLRKVIEDLKNK
jgi:cell division protein FtsB